jgi:hypothetical protein
MSKYVIFVEGGVHGGEPIVERPEINLRNWRVARTDAGSHHFIGHDIEECEGRVSTAIARFDRTTRKGVTASGRVYEVHGDPGHNADAEYVWRMWMRANRLAETSDVTTEYL